MQHLYEGLKKDITYNPAQADQYIQLDEPELPDFLLHIDEEEDPMPCFAMTNPYEALLMHDPDRLCVRVSPDMLHSFQPTKMDVMEQALMYGILRIQVRHIFIKLVYGL